MDSQGPLHSLFGRVSPDPREDSSVHRFPEIVPAIAAALVFPFLFLGMGVEDGRADTTLERFRIADEPRVSERVIEQGEWASELVFALGLSGALPEDHRPEDLFGLLCPEQIERTTQSGGHRAPTGAPFTVAVAAPAIRQLGDSVRVVVSLPATAIYALSVSGFGPQRWAVDQRTIGHLDPSALGVDQADTIIPLRAGPHELTAYLGHDARVEQVELSAYRPLCISPAGGWRANRLLSFAASARTLVAALGLERMLPIDDDAPISLEGESYQSASAYGGRTDRGVADSASDGAWAAAVDSPAEFTYRARIERPGVFSLLARTHGAGAEIWSIDGRYRVKVRPTKGVKGFDWTHVTTLHLDSGEHLIRALLPRGAGIDTMRLIRRRGEDADYISVLEDAGFRSGVPDQPVTHTDAYRNLSNPIFAEVSSHFRARLSGNFQRAPWWVRKAEVERASDANPVRRK
jgi:hypothetical protein